jgi:hypothetical protein
VAITIECDDRTRDQFSQIVITIFSPEMTFPELRLRFCFTELFLLYPFDIE